MLSNVSNTKLSQVKYMYVCKCIFIRAAVK